MSSTVVGAWISSSWPSRGMIAVPIAKNSIMWLPQPWLFSCRSHADDALGADLLRLGLHPLHRQLARVVERLGEVRQLDVAARLRHRLQHAAVGHVVDAAAHHHPHGRWPVCSSVQKSWPERSLVNGRP